jgi:hypothetical protein
MMGLLCVRNVEQNTMKIQTFQISDLIDVALQASRDKTPLYIWIVAGPGTGKSWACESIQHLPGVAFLNKVYSPKTHRELIGLNSPSTMLLINDDLGLCTRWNAKEYFSTFIMCIDGEIEYKQYKNTTSAKTNFSIILLSTEDYYNQNYDDVKGMGLYDRIIPVVVKLSHESRKERQKFIGTSINSRHPPQRNAKIFENHGAQDLSAWDLEPRLISNMNILSQYFSKEQMDEIVQVVKNPGRYEV